MKELYLNYGYSPDKEAVDRSLELIASNLDNVVSDEVIRDCFSLWTLPLFTMLTASSRSPR